MLEISSSFQVRRNLGFDRRAVSFSSSSIRCRISILSRSLRGTTMEKISRAIGRKREREEEIEEENFGEVQTLPSLGFNPAFCSTLAAVQQCSGQDTGGQRIGGLSLRKEKVLRIFKLNTGQDDHAIMLMDDYLNQVGTAVKSMEAKYHDEISVFDWFKTHVIGSKLDTSIGHEELCALLSLGGEVKDDHISLLINAGLLTRQLIDSNMYWFAIPNIGFVLKGLSQGRKELLSLLNRRKYKEMLMAPLEKKHLRLSPLDMRFHLRDLIGSGHLKTIQTPTGLAIRVSKD
ncbi:uncharacterized protein LOC131240394 isoform X2 [Magnolia sinica]|uniref:uncharacterized protein LOC131240394 isoform X2 n=1 Tax=Magnolia sinica TaxID=86752 RepID=UPI0026588360|nr:uncharacterized protein LOC131240394 isoform X2 [Magnolia sinica]